MPRPPDPTAPSQRSSTRARRLAFVAAIAATAGVLALDGLALLRLGSAAPTAAQAWLLALGMACVAAAVGWTLWRQRALSAELRHARCEALALLELCDAWTWEADAEHRLTRWLPPAGTLQQATLLGDGIGRPVWDFFDADPSAAAVLRARLQSGLPLHAQMAALHLPGDRDSAVRRFELNSLPLTDEVGRTSRWIGSARAIDAAAARDHERRVLDALLPALPLPVFELAGGEQGPARVKRANAAALQWLGVKPGELPEMEVADLLSRLPQDLRITVTHALAEPRGPAAAPPCAGWQVQVRRVHEGGEGPLNGDGSAAAPRHWVLTLMPLARAEIAVSAAASGTDSESFSYTVSHDLRAPIRVVEGFTKILKEDYGRQLDRIGNDHLDRVLGAAARMNSMIDALLALSQLSSRPLSRQPVNLSQLAAYVVEDLRRQAPERTVAVHVEGGLVAQGDPTLLRVVLENLIGNAWKYTARARSAQIWLERGLHAGQDVFTVRDNGAGFDMRFADRLFGVFQRLHSASDFAGTGIGLASVRRIVARHGGEIWAESVVDRGSSFHFTIPASHGNAG